MLTLDEKLTAEPYQRRRPHRADHAPSLNSCWSLGAGRGTVMYHPKETTEIGAGLRYPIKDVMKTTTMYRHETTDLRGLGRMGHSGFFGTLGFFILSSAILGNTVFLNKAWAQTIAPPEVTHREQVAYKEEKGALPDGTGYLIRIPEEWNGTLIRDLDYVAMVGQQGRADRYEHLLNSGYALAGTGRHPLRQWQYDPAREISKLDLVLDRFEATYGEPERVIQFGCSGGGHVSLAVAEDFSDRIDGSVVLSGHTPVWIMNSFLDGWFALQSLLGEYYVEAGHGPASDLAITELLNDGSSNPSGHGMTGSLPEAWRKAFDAAQESPEGRARMALAFVLGQWPAWMADDTSKPDLNNVEELQEAMYHSLLRLSQSPGGEARIMFENSAQGQQLSWNENVDYAEFYENGNPALKNAVEQLYQEAGLDLQADIQKINDMPGVLASSHAMEYWSAPGRTIVGDPKIPVIRLHSLGDYQIPYTLMLGYEDLVAENGNSDLLRTALIRSTGHCTESAISTAESTAAIEVLNRRLDAGEWPSTEAKDLNALANSLGTGTPARFMPLGGHDVGEYNRAWVPAASSQDN